AARRATQRSAATASASVSTTVKAAVSSCALREKKVVAGVKRSVVPGMRTSPPAMRSEPIGSEQQQPALRVAWRALWTSRLVVIATGILAVLSLGRAPGTAGFDPVRLTAPFGYFGNLLVAPLARWDSVWYLAIAHGGYDHEPARTAFFPLYPLVTRGLGVVIGSDLVAGVIVSLIAFGVALALLYRLAAIELGERRAE